MTTKIDITLTVDGSKKKFTREGLSVRETINFYEMQEEIIKKVEEGNFRGVDSLMTRTDYIASLFDGVEQDMVIDGLGPDEFEKEWTRIMKIIAPSEFDGEAGK